MNKQVCRHTNNQKHKEIQSDGWADGQTDRQDGGMGGWRDERVARKDGRTGIIHEYRCFDE